MEIIGRIYLLAKVMSLGQSIFMSCNLEQGRKKRVKKEGRVKKEKKRYTFIKSFHEKQTRLQGLMLNYNEGSTRVSNQGTRYI